MRKPIISRTMVVTKGKAFCVHLATQETFEYDFELPRTYPTAAKLEKALRKEIDTDECRFCYIIKSDTEKKLYAMTEQDFLKNAKQVTDRSAEALKALFGEGAELESSDEQ